MNHFIESYYSSVLNSVTRLTGLTDEEELKTLAEAILRDLEQRKEELAAERRKGVFIYKVVLTHVFSFLEAKGAAERIGFLQKILLIHPSHYAQLPPKGPEVRRDINKDPLHGTSQQGDVDI